MTDSQITFEDWYAEEQKKGLVDIKFAINTRGASNREAKDDVLKIEALINGGITATLPTRTNAASSEADQIISSKLAAM